MKITICAIYIHISTSKLFAFDQADDKNHKWYEAITDCLLFGVWLK